MFGFLYTFLNILMIIFHFNLSPIMLAWINTAPLDKNSAIDNVNPWSRPENYAAVVELVVDEEEVEEDKDSDEDSDEDEEDEEEIEDDSEEDDEAF